MKILIFGASGGTGRHLVEQGLAAGHRITAFVRNTEAAKTEDANLRLVKGELSDHEKINEAVAGQDAVISVLGNPTGTAIQKSNTIISDGLANIIRSMKEQDVKRIVFVTSFGVSENIFFPEKLFIKIFLKNIFADIPRQETILKNSGLEWTIVRPARLINEPKTGRYQAGEDLRIGIFSKIARADLADFLLKTAADQKDVGKIITVSY